MTLCFWNNGKPKSISNTKRLVLPNGDVVFNPQPNPEMDIYEYTLVKPAKSIYQYYGAMTYELVGNQVVATYDVLDMALDTRKQLMLAQVKTKRDTVINGGIDWTLNSTTYSVQTDPDSRREMTGAVLGINESGATQQVWRMADNVVAILSADDFKLLALAVRDHVNHCYLRQSELEQAINNADETTIDSIDTNSGWI